MTSCRHKGQERLQHQNPWAVASFCVVQIPAPVRRTCRPFLFDHLPLIRDVSLPSSPQASRIGTQSNSSAFCRSPILSHPVSFLVHHPHILSPWSKSNLNRFTSSPLHSQISSIHTEYLHSRPSFVYSSSIDLLHRAPPTVSRVPISPD